MKYDDINKQSKLPDAFDIIGACVGLCLGSALILLVLGMLVNFSIFAYHLAQCQLGVTEACTPKVCKKIEAHYE